MKGCRHRLACSDFDATCSVKSDIGATCILKFSRYRYTGIVVVLTSVPTAETLYNILAMIFCPLEPNYRPSISMI